MLLIRAIGLFLSRHHSLMTVLIPLQPRTGLYILALTVHWTCKAHFCARLFSSFRSHTNVKFSMPYKAMISSSTMTELELNSILILLVRNFVLIEALSVQPISVRGEALGITIRELISRLEIRKA